MFNPAIDEMKKRHVLMLVIATSCLSACDTLHEESTQKHTLSQELRSLPISGSRSIPVLSEVTLFSAEGDSTTSSRSLNELERSQLKAIIEAYQTHSGQTYVMFTSVKQENQSYRYRYKTLNVPDSLIDSSQNRLSYYFYKLKQSESEDSDKIVAAVIPDHEHARAIMNEWVGIITSKRKNLSHSGTLPARLNLSQQQGQADFLLGSFTVIQRAPDCDYSEQIVYHPECSCFGYEYVEVCDESGGGGSDINDDLFDEIDDCDDPFGCNEGGDGGTGGGTGDESECPTEEIACQDLDDLQYVSKGDATAKYNQVCQEFSNDKLDKFFHRDVRTALGMDVGVNPMNPDQGLDGVKYGVLINNQWDFGILDKVLEVKFSSGSGVFSFSQSQAHIDLLYDSYLTFLEKVDWHMFAPSYWGVSLVPDVERFDFTGQVVPYANERHIIVYHLRLFKNILNGEYFLKGQILGNTWGAPRITGSVPFTFGCEV